MDLPFPLLPLFTTFVHLVWPGEFDEQPFGLTGDFPQLRLISRGCCFYCVVRPVLPFVSFPALVVFDWSDSKSDWYDSNKFDFVPSPTLVVSDWSESNSGRWLWKIGRTQIKWRRSHPSLLLSEINIVLGILTQWRWRAVRINLLIPSRTPLDHTPFQPLLGYDYPLPLFQYP